MSNNLNQQDIPVRSPSNENASSRNENNEVVKIEEEIKDHEN